MTLVDARELFAVYPSATGGVAALQGLTLAVDEDEICVVLGPSGSGKTTLMRVLAGLARPSAGSLVVAGVDLLHASEGDLGRYRRDALGYADQHYWRALAGELTAEQLVAVPLGLASCHAQRSGRAHGSCSSASASSIGRTPALGTVRRRAAADRVVRGARAAPKARHPRRADR